MVIFYVNSFLGVDIGLEEEDGSLFLKIIMAFGVV